MHRQYPPKAAAPSIRVRDEDGAEATHTFRIVRRLHGTSFQDAATADHFIANRDPQVAVRYLCDARRWTLLEIL